MKISSYDFILAHGQGKAVFSLERGVYSLFQLGATVWQSLVVLLLPRCSAV